MKRILTFLLVASAALAQVPQIPSSAVFNTTRTATNTALVYLDTNKIQYIGAYNPSTTYAQQYTVVYNGIPYVSLQASNTGNTPSSSPTFWSPLIGVVPSVNGGTGVANSATLTLGTANVNLATLGSGIVKNTTTTGALSIAVASVDYAPPTLGASILYGNGSGGFSNLVLGTGLSFSAGTLSPSYPALCGAGQFSQGLTASSSNCSTPTGGGNVVSSGSPSQYQVAIWNNATSILGVGPGTVNTPLLSGGASANPSYSSIAYPTSLTSGGLLYASSTTQIANSADFTLSSHTLAGGASAILDLSATSPTAGLRIPVAAGALPTVNGYVAVNATNSTLAFGSNGNTLVAAVAATGIGTGTTCTNQFISAVSGVAGPTCSTVANAALANSAITIAGTSVSLGGATTAFPVPGPIGGTTPSTGAFTTLSASGQFTSTVTTGTAPFVVSSTTVVTNLQAATAANLNSYPALCTGSQFSQGLSSGSNNCSTPPGGGNVSNSGTPTQYQVAVWTNSTAIAGVGPGSLNVPLLGQGSANPAFSSIAYPTSATSGGGLYFSSTSAIASTGLLAANALMVGGGAGSPFTTGNGDFTYSSHTLAGGSSAVLDMSAASTTAGLKLPSGAGAVPTADGTVATNTTTHSLVYGSNGTTLVSAVAATGTGTATTCSNQVVTVVSGIAAPTCTALTSAYLPLSAMGTMTGGTWNASLIGMAYGGTNANLTAALGSIPYSTASAIALLGGNTAATDQVLTSTGTGSAAQAPTLKNAPALSAANMTSFPTLNQNTTGNAATATNLASYPTLCSGGQFSQGLSSGSNNCATPGASSVPWSSITSAAANLTLSNAGYTTTFNQTSAVAWTWANTTAATSSVSQSSPVATLLGTEWHAAASTPGGITFQFVPGSGTDAASTLNISHTGSATGTVTTDLPGPLSLPSDGVHPSQIQLIGNTTAFATASNVVELLGPNSATFTGYGIQYSATAPAAAGIVHVGAPSSGISQLSYSLIATADITANAVNSSKLAVVNTYRDCDISVGDTSGSAISNGQLGPQSRICFIPAAATIVELDVNADGGTPNVIVGRNHAGTISNIVSSALATASSGGIACSNTGGTTGLNGVTTCSSTLQNTSLSAGDYLELVSGTAGGTAKFFVAHVVYTVN